MTALTAAASSLIEKYQCPEAAWVKLEISPRTQTWGNSEASKRPTARLSCPTEKMTPDAASTIKKLPRCAGLPPACHPQGDVLNLDPTGDKNLVHQCRVSMLSTENGLLSNHRNINPILPNDA